MHWPEFSCLRSLRFHLMASYVFALLLTAVAAGTLLYFVFSLGSDASTRKGLAIQAQWIEQAMQFDAAGKPTAIHDDRNAPWVYESAADDLKYRVLDGAGAVLWLPSPARSRCCRQARPSTRRGR